MLRFCMSSTTRLGKQVTVQSGEPFLQTVSTHMRRPSSTRARNGSSGSSGALLSNAVVGRAAAGAPSRPPQLAARIRRQERPRRRGAGGARRAFIRSATFGQRQRPCFKALSRAFHQLSGEEKKHFEVMGQAATHLARHGGRAFGANSRQLQRAGAKRRLQHALEDGASDIDPIAKKPRRVDTADSLAIEPFVAYVVPSDPWTKLKAMKEDLLLERKMALSKVRQLGDCDGELRREGRPGHR